MNLIRPEQTVTLRQIAEKANIAKRTVERRALRESWTSCGTVLVNHNETKLYAVSSLPEDIQNLLNAKKTSSNIAPLILPVSSAAEERGDFLPSTIKTSPTTEVKKINDVPLTAIPEDAKRIALARMDLINVWENFRTRFHSLLEGDQEFEKWYQTGQGAPHLYNILGSVSVKSLNRWKQQLGGSADWRNIVPRYKWSGMVLQTSLDLNIRRIFERFLLDPRRLKIAQCIFYTRESLNLSGTGCDASDAVFYRYADWYQKTHNDVWTFRREGNKALMDKVLLYIKRDPGMLEVGDCLVADGHRMNFQIINPFTGRPARATMLGYLDWKSYNLAGYEIMIEENTQCIASALRHSIIKLGKRPKFCYQDNGKAFRAKYFTSAPSFEESGFFGLFARFNIVPVFSLPYNARAKVIERWWGIFSESFERLLPSYVGASISDKPAYMLRNEKFHKALRGEYTPTIWETVELIDQWLDLWSNRTECPHVPGKTVRQVFDEGRGSGIDLGELDDLMMDTKVSKIYQNGIRMWGEYYWHEAIYGKQYDEVIIRYSIFDKSKIKVFSSNGTFICTASKNEAMNPLVNYLGTEEQKEKFKNVIEMRGRLRKGTIHQARKIEEAPMPIAVNAVMPNQLEGPRPGVLMMNAVAEVKPSIESMRGEVNLSAFIPVETEQSKIFLYECDREDAINKANVD